MKWRKEEKVSPLPEILVDEPDDPSVSYREIVDRVIESESSIESVRSTSIFEKPRVRISKTPFIILGVSIVTFGLVYWLAGKVVRSDNGETPGTTLAQDVSTTAAVVLGEEDLQALFVDGYRFVDVTMAESTVYLDGVIPAAYLGNGLEAYRQGAQAKVENLSGVTEVVNRIEAGGDPLALYEELNRLAVDGELVFRWSKSEIHEEHESVLDSIAEAILENPGVKVLVIGHSDVSGVETDDQSLEEDRAEAIAKYLVDKGVDPEWVDVISFESYFGVTEPLIWRDRIVRFATEIP